MLQLDISKYLLLGALNRKTRSVSIAHIFISSQAVTHLFKNLSAGNRQPLDTQKSLQSHLRHSAAYSGA